MAAVIGPPVIKPEDDETLLGHPLEPQNITGTPDVMDILGPEGPVNVDQDGIISGGIKTSRA